MMEIICQPDIVIYPEVYFRSIVLDSILHTKLVFDPFYAYLFYRKYPKLAQYSLSIIIGRDGGVLDKIDTDLDYGFQLATLKGLKPVDWWAAYIAMGGQASVGLLAQSLNKTDPIGIFEIIRRFYEEVDVKTFRPPFSFSEWESLCMPLDGSVGSPARKFVERSIFTLSKGTEDQFQVIGEGLCISDITDSQLFASHGYAFVPSHALSILPGYGEMFNKIEETLKQDIELSKAFKMQSIDESLKYLLGKKMGGLNELLGFTPFNPLELVSKNTANEQVDELVLEIRKKCKKIRELSEEVHVNCLKKEIDKAINAKRKLGGVESSQSLNYTMLDITGDFVDVKLRDTIHEFIDRMIEDEAKSDIIKLHRSLKGIKKKLGWISEVKFLTFGALTILAAYGIDASLITEVFQALGTAGLSLGGAGITLRLLEKGMEIFPGFNIYASFIDWPKIDQR
ncbi:hypothetical protein GTO27_13460 [Candidatus Bathyarchaeota archaeon]|nr:hypothetical protein [Candidatus Bathyarchaeota archaeon]